MSIFGHVSQSQRVQCTGVLDVSCALHDFSMSIICFLDLRTLGILTHLQPNGLAVPDASMQPVNSTSDVIEIMDTGLRNRAVGATALNERSSRSHRLTDLIY